MLQDQVVLIGKVKDQSMLLAVCRNTGNTAFKGFFRRFIDNLFSQHLHAAGFCLLKACEDFHQLRLAVSVHACKTYDFSPADR